MYLTEDLVRRLGFEQLVVADVDGAHFGHGPANATIASGFGFDTEPETGETSLRYVVLTATGDGIGPDDLRALARVLPRWVAYQAAAVGLPLGPGGKVDADVWGAQGRHRMRRVEDAASARGQRLSAVAESYLRAVDAGLPVAATVATEHHVSEKTARNLIHQARSAGHLPATTPGRKGTRA